MDDCAPDYGDVDGVRARTLAGALLGWEKRSKSLDYLFMPLLTILGNALLHHGIDSGLFLRLPPPWFR